MAKSITTASGSNAVSSLADKSADESSDKRANKPAGRPMEDEGGKDAIFREVDEELRREQLAKIWEKYGTYILGAAALIIVGVGGYKWNEGRQIKQMEAAGARYDAARELATTGKADDAQAAFDEIAKTGPAGYALLARMRIAATHMQAGKTEEALAEYEAIASKPGDPLLVDFAKLQIAQLKLDTADWTAFQNRFIALTDNANPWRYAAREVLGTAAFKAGKFDEARKFVEVLLGDRRVPSAIAERARIIMGSIVAAELAQTAPIAPVVPNSGVTAPVSPVAAPTAANPADAAEPPKAEDKAAADKKKKK
jgi:hypothetical protein